ncbi:hypothetical protein Daus18300_012166 [Diaporthe australafricana]|uniref:Heterokaryon incompatibility domain-containing protein n=1 Tax=Diaporthe australafricana TaxID=127596 RepID=A0ABR3W3X8_9PEZI
MASNKNGYSYKVPLEESCIRLLTIKPGNEADPLELHLSTVSLNTSPVYEALSYCWGDTSPTNAVLCDEHDVSITTSLFGALGELRYPTESRTIWADALCIDQTNVDDKTQQVRLFHRIYSQAARTIIWLGPDELDPAQSLRDAGKLIQGGLALARSVTLCSDSQASGDVLAQRLEDSPPSLLDYDWGFLKAIFRRPWFWRKWIVQEVALAKEVVVAIGGGIRFLWLDLAMLSEVLLALDASTALVRNLEEADFQTTPDSPGANWGGGMYNAKMIMTIQNHRVNGTLLDAAVATMAFQCSDEHDYIYGISSLPGQGPMISADYTISVGETFKRFAEICLVEGQSLKVLGLAPDKLIFPLQRDIARLPGLPSWVPDLRLIGQMPSLVSYGIDTFREQWFYAGGRDVLPTLSVSGNILQCRGIIIDRVGALVEKSLVERIGRSTYEVRASIMQSMPIRDNFPSMRETALGEWLQACCLCALRGASSSILWPDSTRLHTKVNEVQKELDAGSSIHHRLSTELLADLSRTMICDFVDGDQPTLEAEQLKLVRDLLTYVFDSCEDPSIQLPQSLSGEDSAFNTSMAKWSAVRRFCFTSNGRLGHLAPGSEPGDCICVLGGAEVPFVIRPISGDAEGTYQLVGECYLDGMMYGEAWKLSDHVEENINLV